MVLPITIKICEYPFKSLYKVPSVKFHSDSMRLARLCGDKFPRNFFVKRLRQAAVLIASQRALLFSFFFESPFLLILERTWKTDVSATAQRPRVAASHYPSSLVNKIVDEYFSQIPNCSRPPRMEAEHGKKFCHITLTQFGSFPVVTSQCELAIHLPIYCKINK